MVVINEDTGNFDIFVGSYEGLSNQTKYSVGSGPIYVALADFNNDTQLDISVINYDSSDMSILLGYGDGTFASQTAYSVGVKPISIAIGDFNNDI